MAEKTWLARWFRYVICRNDSEAVKALNERRREERMLDEQLERWYREGTGQPDHRDWSEEDEDEDPEEL